MEKGTSAAKRAHVDSAAPEPEQNKLQFRIDIALTALFLATIFFLLFGTIAFQSGLLGHAINMHYVGHYLKDSDDYSVLDLVQASISSLDHYISENTYGRDVLGKVNTAFQYALGKRLVSTGGAQMIRLNTGHLYDLQTEMSMESARDDILAMREIVPEETPFLFVYEHPTLYEPEVQMPEGYEFLDFGQQEADSIVGMLRDEGIEVMDSREILPASGVPMEDYLMYTDQHWSTRAAIIMAQQIARRAQELTGRELPLERLDIDQFETEVHEKLFMGKYGQRVGTLLIDPDDIITYKPKYDTDIWIRTNRRDNITEKEGPFEEVCLRKDALKPDEGKSWNTKGYVDYGLTEVYDMMRNADGGDCTILLLKDSYSAPIGRFLSLVADEVYSVDMRQYRSGSLEEWINEYHPDVVLAAYSLQMLRDESYEFE